MLKVKQLFLTTLILAPLSSTGIASDTSHNDSDEANNPRKVAYVGSDSVCYDGFIAIIDGKGCSAIKSTKIMDSSYTLVCTEKTKSDEALEGTYYFISHGSQMPESLLSADLMCIDSNYTTMWQK